MRKRIYIETTVVSYLVANLSRDVVILGHQEATRSVWANLRKKYEPFISALVYQEASRGNAQKAAKRLDALRDIPMLEVDQEAERLAVKIVHGKGIPEKFPEDALHIAIAAVNGIELVLTWNFAHMNNPFTRMLVRQIVENEGYVCPEICSPDELLEAHHD